MKRLSVKKQVEKNPNIIKQELVWTKGVRKSLKVFNTSHATEHSATVDEKLVPKSHLFIHTHLQTDRSQPQAVVSSGDIVKLSNLMKGGKVKTGVIASIDKKGKVSGYTIFKINKLFPEECVGQFNLAMMFSTKENYNYRLIEILKKLGITFKQRFVPMPGYKFDNESG